MPTIPAVWRKWIYAVCLAAVPLLVIYGAIDSQSAPLWIALVGAIVAPSLALANVPSNKKKPVDDEEVK